MSLESKTDNLIQKFSKGGLTAREIQTAVVTVAGGALAAVLVKYYLRKRKEAKSDFLKVPEKDLVKENNLTNEMFNEVIKKYGDKFNNSQIFEKIIPREFKKNNELEKVCCELRYSDKYDVNAATKVNFDIPFLLLTYILPCCLYFPLKILMPHTYRHYLIQFMIFWTVEENDGDQYFVMIGCRRFN